VCTQWRDNPSRPNLGPIPGRYLSFKLRVWTQHDTSRIEAPGQATAQLPEYRRIAGTLAGTGPEDSPMASARQPVVIVSPQFASQGAVGLLSGLVQMKFSSGGAVGSGEESRTKHPGAAAAKCIRGGR
jgi:hypothetical protein